MNTLNTYNALEVELDTLTDGSRDPDDCCTQAAHDRAERIVRAMKYLARRDY